VYDDNYCSNTFPQNIQKLNYIIRIFKSQKKIFYNYTNFNITVHYIDIQLKSLEEFIIKVAYHE
jgi:hypothetical protein